jgi:LPPG:FO 2-phospho-L-lactate transferase
MICAICGGTGGARLARGINYVYDPAALTYICNVGDNIQLFGLSICPDIDTIIYYLSGSADFDRGWGLRDETFNLLEGLRLFSPDFWFGLGDKDMATHIWRTELLHNGASLSEVTARESQLWGIQARVLPATDSWVETWIETAAHASLHYEEYFVRYRCVPRVSRVRYVGIESSQPAPGVLEAIASSRTIFLAPSNPIASILSIISVPGIREALVSNRKKIWAISPVIEALELPAGERIRARSRERLLAAFGLPHSPVSVGQLYKDFCSHFVLDERNFACKSQLEELGYDVYLLKTDALSFERQKELARELLQLTEDISIAGVGPVSEAQTARG